MNPQAYVTDLCEQIDAGIFSGDLLQTCDLTEFMNYLGRWTRAANEELTHRAAQKIINVKEPEE
jgi:hypothetical protein